MNKENIAVIEEKLKDFYGFEDDIIKQIINFRTFIDALDKGEEILTAKTVDIILNIILKRIMELNSFSVNLFSLISEELEITKCNEYYVDNIDGENDEGRD